MTQPISLDLVTLESISLDRWRDMLTALGHDVPSNLTYKLVGDLLQTTTSRELLADLVQAMADLGNEAGREALIDALAEHGLDGSGWYPGDSAQDFAARVWVRARTEDRVDDAVARAQLQVRETRPHRRHQEFAGQHAARINAKANRSKIRGEVAAWCNSTGRSDYAEVRTFSDGERSIFEIIRGHRLVAPLVITENGRSILRYRPAHCDVIEYDASNGRLKISTQSRELVRVYRQMFGFVFFEDVDFFDDSDLCTLEPLQVHGRAALDRHSLSEEIARVQVTELHWRDGSDKMVLKGRDCMRTVERRRLPINEGELLEAKLTFTFLGNGPKRMTVTIKVPNRIDYHRDVRRTDSIERFLTEVGFRTPRTGPLDFWSLAAEPQREDVWRSAYGKQIDEMVVQGLLVRARLGYVEHPDHPGAAALAVCEADGELYGITEDDGVPARRLTASDVEALQLNELKLARNIAAGMALSGSVEPVAHAGLIDLGRRQLGNVDFAAMLVHRRPVLEPAAIVECVRMRARGAHPVLVVPAGLDVGCGLAQITFASPAGPFTHLIAEAIDALGIADRVPAIVRAKPGTRLVIDRKLGEAHLDGVKLLLTADSNPFRLMQAIVEADGAAVNTKEVGARLSPSAPEPNETARAAKHDLLKKIRESFQAVDAPVPPDVKKLFDGYRLNISAFIA